MHGLVTVFGGSGFVGGQVVRALAKRGVRIRVAVRNPGQGYRLRMLGDVGQIEVVQANIRMPTSVTRALDGAEGCINLVAVMHERGRQKFQSLHAMGARTVAEAAKTAGVTRLVHISAIGADAGSPSKYARTKAMGESAVREVMPSATILRPSIVFGPEDDFFNRFARMACSSPVLPLIGGGLTKFQPVFVGDVANAVAACLLDADTAGKTYELGGPGVFTFRALMEKLCEEIGRRPILLPVPFGVASLIGVAGDLVNLQPFPIAPPLTTDQAVLLRADNVAAPGALTLADLKIAATALEPILPTYLYRYRKGGQYAEQLTAAAKA
jgi:NADH dehydrogenase